MKSRIVELIPEIDRIKDEDIKKKVISIWEKAIALGGWDDPSKIPFNPTIGLPPSLIDHTLLVTRTAIFFATEFEQTYGKGVDWDLLITSSVLHDVSKVLEFKPHPERITKSEIGEKVPHGYSGGFLAQEAGLPLDYIHMIVTHTPAVAMLPGRLEGVILRYADLMDADCHYFRAGLPTLMPKSK